MGYRTYETQLGESTLQLKMKKKDAERTISRIKRAYNVNKHRREINGLTTDAEPRTHVYWSPFEVFAIADPDAWRSDLQALEDRLPDLLTYENVGDVLQQADDIFNRHIPVDDKRQTPEEHQRKQAESQRLADKHRAEREAKRAAWINQYGKEQTVNVPEGSMAVYLSAHFNDSDAMTDYFNSNAGVGNFPDMLLGIVKKQARREDLARRIVSRYPELATLKWSWHTEEYSGGHGTYLQSAPVGTLEGKTTYGGRTDPPYWLEVSFNRYTTEWEVLYKDYPGNVAAQNHNQTGNDLGENVGEGEAIDGTPFTVFRGHKGMLVQFAGKPSAEVRTALKDRRYRWSRRLSCWYRTGVYGPFKTVAEIIA